MKFKIPKDILKIHKIFTDNGFELLLVGGAVRDFITGDKVKDYDLATNATQEEKAKILTDNGISNYEKGKSFGVVVATTEDDEYEIATYREDVTKGRHPEVKYGATLEEEYWRRDLTINGLYYDIGKKEIIDVSGYGVGDIKNRTIAFIGDPKERIEEDRLRIMRCYRFFARYDGKFSATTKEALLKYPSLEGISKERIFQDEILKAHKQCGKNFDVYINTLSEFDMWKHIFVGFKTTNIKIDKTDSYDIVLILSQILKDNDSHVFVSVNNKMKTLKIEDYITYEQKIANNYSYKIGFLIRFIKDFNIEDVSGWYKQFIRSGLTKKELSDWLHLNKIGDSLYTCFLAYEPFYTAIEVMDELGLAHVDGILKSSKDGALLGETMKKKEADRYAEIIR